MGSLPHLDLGAPSRLTIDRAKQAYRGLDDDGSRAASVTASEEEAVRMELGLARSRTIRELQQLRRRFARANHPDRAPRVRKRLVLRRPLTAPGSQSGGRPLPACGERRSKSLRQRREAHGGAGEAGLVVARGFDRRDAQRDEAVAVERQRRVVQQRREPRGGVQA